ncbi:MAG: permease [Armatimonadota bacterium]|nr:permease [Armatimonadota bacterium]MDR7444665.1 permease [Armatimonadota bacterium]MDR7569491.1 permease [Armatimonadota bacterium]MDR7613626.1 permease [Armatimonadota bacterium]
MASVEAGSYAKGRPVASRYSLILGVFLGFVGLLLFTVVDLRRGFLLPPSLYTKVGSPSAILYFHPIHLLLLSAALLGSVGLHRALARGERRALAAGVDLPRARNVTAGVLLVALVVDLFVYRGVQAARIAHAGHLGVSFAFPVPSFPGWARPVAEAVNYLLVTWHATTLGILIGGLLLVLLRAGAFEWLEGMLRAGGLRAHVAGSLLALPYPFCSCCAGPVGASLSRAGTSLDALLSFLVASPMLNLTTLVLATALLPAPYALLRILGGVVLAVFGTHLVLRVLRTSGRVVAYRPSPWMDRLARLFALEQGLAEGDARTPATLVTAWLRTSWRLARVAIPVLFLAAVLTGALAPVIVSFAGRNDLPSTLKAAAAGTLLMIPTWTELAVARPLIQQGITGPAAALLLTLPAVSLPSLAVVGMALGDYRPCAFLAGTVFLAGILAGLAFGGL